MLMDCMNINLRMCGQELFDFPGSKANQNFPLSPLDSVVWYRVYTFLRRRDRDGDSLDWTSGTQSRGRRGNGAVLRARGLAGGTAAPCLWLSSVLRAGGRASPLYSTRTKAGL